MQTFLQDFRLALRQLRKSPGFSATAILSLALGIGATVAVFSIIYAVLLNPWPYVGADRICEMFLVDKAGNENIASLTGPQIRALRQSPVVEGVVGVDEQDVMVTGRDVPEDVYAVDTPGNTFEFLGVPAMLGRYFTTSDAPDGQDPPPVAVLGNNFWRRHYNADPAVVGQTLQLNHKSYAILGVMPPRFAWIDGDVYLPLNLSQNPATVYFTVAKLKPGISYTTAEAALTLLFQTFVKETPAHFQKDYKLRVRNLSYSTYVSLGHTLYLLFGAVALLLLIGCGNVSILLLARGTGRQHEFAVRSAVGASGFRIVRQLLTESLLLAIAGAGLGVLLAYRIVDWIVLRLPEYSFPHEADFHVNLPVLLFSVGVAVLTAVLFGLFPALQLAKPEISQMMQSSSWKVAGSVRAKRLHRALIAGQIALTLLLLTTAGSAIEGFLRRMHAPLGYDPHHVALVGIPVHENTYTTLEERANYFEQLRQKIALTPGVLSAGISANAPPPSNYRKEPFEILGKPTGDQQEASAYFVSPEYFDTLRVPLKQGRLWNHGEMMHGALLVLVNQAFVRRYFPNGDVLGHSVRMAQLRNDPPARVMMPGADGWLQVIGVVGDALDDGLDKPVKPAIFAPYTLDMSLYTEILARTRGEPLSMLHSIQLQIVSVNPDQQIAGQVSGQPDDLEAWLERQREWASGRLISMLFTAFSLLALVLAALGLYSVSSYSVAQRASEFGIRMALGAQRSDVLTIVLASSAVSVGAGVAAGWALSLGISRLLTRWVAASAHGPLILLGGSALLLAVCLLACWLPARKASSVDPMKALRCE
jgi:putative ABC transport system permease protein